MLSNSACHCVEMYPPRRALNPMSLSVFLGSVEMLTAHTSSLATGGWDLHIWARAHSPAASPFSPTSLSHDATAGGGVGGSRHLHLASQLGHLSNGLHTEQLEKCCSPIPGWPGSQPPSGKGDSSSVLSSLQPPEPHPASLCPLSPLRGSSLYPSISRPLWRLHIR